MELALCYVSKVRIAFADHFSRGEIQNWKLHWCANSMKDRLLYSKDSKVPDFSQCFHVSNHLAKGLCQIHGSVRILDKIRVSKELSQSLIESAKIQSQPQG
jgi:hypothetical protein